MPRTPGRARARQHHPRTNSIIPSYLPFKPSIDAKRYALFRAGLSAEEIAAQENVRLATIERSIEKMKMEAQLYSKESVDQASRQSVLSALPTATNSLIAALTATRDKIIATMDSEGQETTTIVQEADHALRLKAIDTLTKLIDSTKESSPMVSIANQNLQQTAVAFSGQPGLSSESIIREIRAKNGLVTPLEISANSIDATAPLPDEIDWELRQELQEEAEEERKKALMVAEAAAEGAEPA